MKIRRVELSNFRQFYGKQSIVFSTDREKNITLIHAENGTGKTAFLNAVLWCFYKIHTDNFKDPKKILNKVAAAEGVSDYFVSIEFEGTEGTKYLAKRGKAASGETFKVFELVDGSTYNELDKPNSFINSVIPKDMAKYFFFQGEGVGKTSGASGEAVVKTALREILGFTIAKSAYDDVSNIKKEYQKQFSLADKSGELSRIQNQIIELEESIQRLQKRIEESATAEDVLKSKLSQAEEKLENSNSAAVKQLNKRRKSAEDSLKIEEARLLRAQTEKRNLVSEFSTTVFGYEFANIALDFIDEAEYKGTVPAPYNEQLVKDILETARCVCGTEIPPGSDAFNNIQELLKTAADPALENRIKKARAQLSAVQSASLRAKSRFTNNMTDLAESEDRIKLLKEEVRELGINIKGTESIENIARIEEERERLKQNLIEATRTNTRLKIDLENDDKELDRKRGELKRLGNFSGELKKYQRLVSVSEKIQTVLKNTLDEAEKDVELRIIEKVNKYLEMFVRQDYTAKLNTSTFDIRLVDSENRIVPESDGQSLLLSLTFISSLIELSRERRSAKGQILTPGVIAPFIVDAPFGDLDNKYKGNVAKAIPNSVEQVVFLLSSSHWEGTVEDNIRAKVGAEYNMVLNVTSERGNKEEDKIKILGKEYESVRYDSPREETVFEEVAVYV